MASTEHVCCRCGHAVFSNASPSDCPKCGSSEITSFFDEPFEVDDIRAERAAGVTEDDA